MHTALVVAIYYHPEAYPPTLNAIEELSSCFKSISVLYRPHLKGNWDYPDNVNLYPSGEIIPARQQEQSSLPRKIAFFFSFTLRMFKIGIIKKPSVFLLYDSMALYSYHLIKPFLFFRHKVWYHNHDVSELDRVRKYSIGWFAAKSEKKKFSSIDIFSLPTIDRLPYFETNKLKTAPFIIPNYPSIKFYASFYKNNKSQNDIRIVFQGRIDDGHGIEKMLQTITKYPELNLMLVLKGYCDESYKNHLLLLSKKLMIGHRLEFYAYTEYRFVPELTSTCHIGIAIFEKTDIMNRSLGTASNKIYEYAALGLPVLYLNNSFISSVMEKYKWAIGIELNEESIYKGIKRIIDRYDYLSQLARKDFLERLNFENEFKGVQKYICSLSDDRE